MEMELNTLEDKGIRVTFGVLEKECKNLHRNFLHFNIFKRPYIILKVGRIHRINLLLHLDKSENKPFWISCIESRQLVHEWRSVEHAILIGYNTVVSDNPSIDSETY